MTRNTSVTLDAVVPAPYGQACGSCTRSKTKCMLRRNNTCCERCLRLKRHCQPGVNRRRRRQTTPRQTTPVGNHASGDVDSGSSLPMERPNLSFRINNADTDISITEAAECLDTFRGFMSRYFPFIHLPLSTSAQQLRTERPFLWLNIVAITTKSINQQQRLGALIRQHVAQNMIIETQKSIDLLLGLLAFLSWYSYLNPSCTKSSLSVFTQLAISLVFDLHLHKIPSQQLPITMKPIEKPKARTMEERRAVLGCFLITSSISQFNQRTDPLRWTAHLAECLDYLVTMSDRSVEDELLIHLVRCQVVVEKAATTFESTDRMPESIYVQALQPQIEDCRRLMPSSTHSKAVASLHLITTEIIIYQMALSRRSNIDLGNEVQRVKYLHSCTESIKTWFEISFTIPASQYYGLPFSMTSQLVRCLQLLYHVSTIDDPAWNCSEVQASIDVLATMDRVIHTFSQVPAFASLPGPNEGAPNMLTRAVHDFRSLRASWAAALSHRAGPPSPVTEPDKSENLNEIEIPEDWEVSWLNGDWWADFL